MKSELITVLDVGSTKVACAAFRIFEDGEAEALAATTVESKGVRRGAVIDLSGTSNAIDAAIKRVHQSAGIEIGAVSLAIGGTCVHGANSQGYLPIYPRARTITREDVLQVINHSRQVSPQSGHEQVQVLPREFFIDGEDGIQAPIGRTGGKLEVMTHVVTADIAYLQNIEKCVVMAGQRLEQMALGSLAAGLAVLTPEEQTIGTAVVDIGGGCTDLAIFQGGAILHSASVPIGGILVSSDLAKLLKTSPDEGDRLKMQYGAAMASMVVGDEVVDVLQLGHTQGRPMQRRVLCEIIESRMKELGLMVREQIGKSGLYGELPGGLVITGGGSELPGTAKLFEELMPGHKVRLGRPSISRGKADSVNNPAMAASVGLALFVARSYDDELSPVAGAGDWKERIRTFWSLLSGRA